MRVLSVLLAAAALLSTSVCARPSSYVQADGSTLLMRRETRGPVLMRRTYQNTVATAHETAASDLSLASHAHTAAANGHTEAHNAHLAAFSRNPTGNLLSGQHVNEMNDHASHAEAHHANAQTLEEMAKTHREIATHIRTNGLPPHPGLSHQKALDSSALARTHFEQATISGAHAHNSALAAAPVHHG